MQKCKPDGNAKQLQLQLDMPGLKKITMAFDGGQVCSDGGLLLLRKADERLGLCELLSKALPDERRPDLVTHTSENLFRQRIFAIAAGYEDCNDAGQLRHDAMHRLAVGYEPTSAHALASQPTLSRFENRANQDSNDLLQRSLPYLYYKSFKRKKPKVIRLSMDTTCDVVHGYQQMSFFNGYYGEFCFAPLFIFSDDGFPLCALLRPGNEDPKNDALRMLKKLVKELRVYWPRVKIELKADAAFAAPEIFEFCEANRVTYYIAAIGHAGLAYHSQELIAQCKKEFDEFGKPSPELLKYAALPAQRARALRQHEERIRFSSKAEGRMQEHSEDELFVRKFGTFQYAAREWSKPRRFVFRVHYTKTGADVRYVVTNDILKRPGDLYDKKYVQRAQCENWIKDLKTYLKCDRTSCQEFQANQFRLFLHVFAYVLIWETRTRAGLCEMTVQTFQLHFLKIGVLVRERSREILLSLASEFPWKDQFAKAWTG